MSIFRSMIAAIAPCERASQVEKRTAKSARPGGRQIKFEAAQWSAAQNRRVIGVNWGAIEALRTRGDNAEKIDRRRGESGRNSSNRVIAKIQRPQIKERLNGVSEFEKPRGERKLRERGEREGWRLRRETQKQNAVRDAGHRRDPERNTSLD